MALFKPRTIEDIIAPIGAIVENLQQHVTNKAAEAAKANDNIAYWQTVKGDANAEVGKASTLINQYQKLLPPSSNK